MLVPSLLNSINYTVSVPSTIRTTITNKMAAFGINQGKLASWLGYC